MIQKRLLALLVASATGCASHHPAPNQQQDETKPVITQESNVETHATTNTLQPAQANQQQVTTQQATTRQPRQNEQPAESPPTPADLRYRFQPEAVLRYAMLVDLQGSTTLDKMLQRSAITTKMDFTLRTKSVDDQGVARVAFIYDTIDCRYWTGAEERLWSSRTLANGEKDLPENACLRAMKGTSFDLLVAPTGEIVSAEGVAQAEQDANDAIADQNTRSLFRTLLPNFNSEFIIANLGGALRCVPGSEQRAGEDWTTETVRPSQAGMISVRTDWTLTKAEHAADTLVPLTGEVRLSMPAANGPLASFYDTTLSNATGKADAKFDHKAGSLNAFHRSSKLSFENTPKPDKDPYKYKAYSQDVTEVLTLDLLPPSAP
jgi:hypothetical protein